MRFYNEDATPTITRSYEEHGAMSIAVNTSSETSESEVQRDFLRCRLSVIHAEQYTKLRVQFGLADDKHPETAAEMVERIKAGLFILPEKDDDWGRDAIRWRDPKVMEDREGFDKAEKALTSACNKAREDVAILPPEQGLASVRTFSEATFA